MPSFFSKLFKNKPDQPQQQLRAKASTLSTNSNRERSPSDSHLGNNLGKVTRSLSSPSSTTSPDKRFIRPKSPTKSSKPAAPGAPLLSLSLPEPKLDEETKSSGIVFETATEGPAVDEQAIKEKSLSPTETLALVQPCSTVILERGLETLGLFKPYWHSSSPDSQLKLITLFLQSLSHPSSTSFQSELEYTRSPHDIASVLKWGLRHFKLDTPTFGNQQKQQTETDQWTWYHQFSSSEQQQLYPVSAFTTILLPLLPSSHADLLKATLDCVSSVAAHADANAMSGSKLSKVLGWWVVSSRKKKWEGWEEFYGEWEKAARVFEHLFLAFVRDQAQDAKKLPVRLTELIRHYPYTSKTTTSANTTPAAPEPYTFLPKPRFTSRSYPAVFIRIKTERTSSDRQQPIPVKIVEEALSAKMDGDGGEYAAFWEDVKKRASHDEEEDADADAATKEKKTISLNRILADETIRILSSVAVPPDSTIVGVGPTSPTISIFTTDSQRRYPYRRRSFSLSDTPLDALMEDGPDNGGASSGAAENPAASSALALPTNSNDWNMFSSAGFGESATGGALAASLVKVEEASSRKSTSQSTKGPTAPNARKSIQVPEAAPRPKTPTPPTPPVKAVAESTISSPTLVQLDEAFIDFWADSLADPVLTTAWPSFVVCQLKSSPSSNTSAPQWLIIEQTFYTPQAPPPSPSREPFPRATSPSPSQQSFPSKMRFGRRTSASSTTTTGAAGGRKRFSIFNTERKISFGKRAGELDPSAVGKMGEKEVPKEVINGKDSTTGKTLVVLPVNAAPEKKPRPVSSPPPARETADTTKTVPGLGVLPVVAPPAAAAEPAPAKVADEHVANGSDSKPAHVEPTTTVASAPEVVEPPKVIEPSTNGNGHSTETAPIVERKKSQVSVSGEKPAAAASQDEPVTVTAA